MVRSFLDQSKENGTIGALKAHTDVRAEGREGLTLPRCWQL